MTDKKRILMFKDKPVESMSREELLVAVHGIMDMYERERDNHTRALDMFSTFNKARAKL